MEEHSLQWCNCYESRYLFNAYIIVKSQGAIERLGAHYDDVQHQDELRKDGTVRDTVIQHNQR